jgi:hypothetical protein
LECQEIDNVILLSFGIFYCSVVFVMAIWYNITRFGMFYQEKSGNPDFEFFTHGFRILKSIFPRLSILFYFFVIRENPLTVSCFGNTAK